MDNLKKEQAHLEDIAHLVSTAGGKYLIERTKESTTNAVQSLMNNYKDLSHIELVAMCARLKENFDMYLLLTGINKQIEAIKEVIEQ